jgi:hypothetical protein
MFNKFLERKRIKKGQLKFEIFFQSGLMRYIIEKKRYTLATISPLCYYTGYIKIKKSSKKKLFLLCCIVSREL